MNYHVRPVVSACALSPGGAACDADPTDPANLSMYRISITVSWTTGAGAAACSGAAATCEYTVTTLRDPSARSVGALKEVPQS